jgi:hypothetical protein
MTRDVIKLQTDVPVVVVLDKGPLGQQVEGNFGTQYQYTVNRDSGVMWVSPQAREALVRSGARAGDDVEILKRMHGKATSFEIRILTPGVPQAIVARTAAPQPSHDPYVDQGSPPPTSCHVTPRPIRTNGNGYANGAPAPPAQPAEESGEQRIGRKVKVCGRIALDAIADWEAYGVKIAVPVKFESDDVRALAITLLIEIMRREGGR